MLHKLAQNVKIRSRIKFSTILSNKNFAKLLSIIFDEIERLRDKHSHAEVHQHVINKLIMFNHGWVWFLPINLIKICHLRLNRFKLVEKRNFGKQCCECSKFSVRKWDKCRHMIRFQTERHFTLLRHDLSTFALICHSSDPPCPSIRVIWWTFVLKISIWLQTFPDCLVRLSFHCLP